MKKYKLTEEHRAQLKPLADKWIDNAMSTKPMDDEDRKAMIIAINGQYAAAGLKLPRIVFAPSPLVARFAAGFAAWIWYCRKNSIQRAATYAVTDATYAATRAATDAATYAVTDATDDATAAATRAATYAVTDATDAATDAATMAATGAVTYAATRAATGAATGAATRAATGAATYAVTDATYAATRAATDAATGAATRAATGAVTYAATRAATGAATGAATRAATDAATGAATRAATDAVTDATDDALTDWFIYSGNMTELAKRIGVGKAGLECALLAWKQWRGNNQWSGWVSYLSFFRHVAKLPIDYSKWQHYENAAIHGGPMLMHEEFCIVSDRPRVLKVDDQNRPHCADGPFCRWSDGFALYAVHGVRTPAWIIERPHLITVEKIESENNAEVRRIMIERYGMSRYLLDSGAMEIHRDDFGVLYRKEIPGDEPLVMVKVVNSTAEPDGTFKDYFLRVPPTMERARQAVAWTFGKEENDYAPLVET